MASETRAVARASEFVAKEKRKPVRRDPERRRQQNIQAQKRYREKLRERLDRLEALAATSVPSSAFEKRPAAGTDPHEVVIPHDSSSTPTHNITQSLPAFDTSDGSVSSSSAATPGEVQHLTPQSDDTPPALSIWDSPTPVDPSLLFPQNRNDAPDVSVSSSSVATPEEFQGLLPQSDGTLSALGTWDSTASIDPSLLIRGKHDDGIGPYSTTAINCGCSNSHVHIRPRGPDPFSHGEVKILCSDRVSLQQIHTPTTSALKHEQIIINHHPYIDILPFPTLRKNLIIHQEEIDEDGFFHDMLTGIVCWGGAGIGRKDRQESTGYASTGTPWDVRSWEARLWFLKKYWTLLGGEDGELVRQSEWWRNMRGDDTLYI
ncbi:MAG: hypothetical protein Q9183_004008 [Haloplaca sp. 2 TL-2023]